MLRALEEALNKSSLLLLYTSIDSSFAQVHFCRGLGLGKWDKMVLLLIVFPASIFRLDKVTCSIARTGHVCQLFWEWCNKSALCCGPAGMWNRKTLVENGHRSYTYIFSRQHRRLSCQKPPVSLTGGLNCTLVLLLWTDRNCVLNVAFGPSDHHAVYQNINRHARVSCWMLVFFFRLSFYIDKSNPFTAEKS